MYSRSESEMPKPVFLSTTAASEMSVIRIDGHRVEQRIGGLLGQIRRLVLLKLLDELEQQRVGVVSRAAAIDGCA